MIELGVICILVVSAIHDMKYRKISNMMLLGFIVFGILGRITWAGFPGIKDSILAFLVPLILLPFYSTRILGAGDIKLLMVVGFWIGSKDNLHLMVYSSLVGGVLSIAWIGIDRYRWQRMIRLKNYIVACILHKKVLEYEETSCGGRKNNFPLAVAILLGYCLLLYQKYFGSVQLIV